MCVHGVTLLKVTRKGLQTVKINQREKKMNLKIKAERDEGSIGEDRIHFVFPDSPKPSYEKAMVSEITGGLYIKKGTVVPNSVTIVLSEEPKEKSTATKEEKKRSKT